MKGGRRSQRQGFRRRRGFLSPVWGRRKRSAVGEVNRPWMACLVLSQHGCCVGTALPEALCSWLARRATPQGCVLLVTFLAQARKVTRPLPCSLATEFLRQYGRNSPQALQGRWHCFARLHGATSHKACLIRASNFLCLLKESHQRNAPR